MALWPLSALADGAPCVLVRASASGWPQWRGPCRDGVSAETGLLQVWPEGGPKLVWRAAGIGKGYSSPVISRDGIFVTGDLDKDLVVSAFTLEGRPLWKALNGSAWKKSYPGARSTCAVDDRSVYHLNAYGGLTCLDAATGSNIWSVNVLERYGGSNITWGLCESVLVDGDCVFATPAGAKGAVAALDKRTGATVWAAPPIGGEQASYCSPILVDTGRRRLVVNCGSKHAFAVDAETGALAWRLPHMDPKNSVNITPMLSGGLALFNNASSDFGAIFGVPVEGAPLSRAWTSELTVGHNGMVCVNGWLYGVGFHGQQSGWMAVDAKSGRLKQMKTLKELDVGTSIFADRRLYCLTAKGLMTLQEITDNGFQGRGSFSLVQSKVQDAWALPAVCGGRLYLRYHETLFCYDIQDHAVKGS